MYIYIYRERERDTCMHVCIYIYIYIMIVLWNNAIHRGPGKVGARHLACIGATQGVNHD